MSDAVIISIIGAVTSTIASYFAWQSKRQSVANTKKIDVLHESVNGKMERLLEVTGTAAKAEGKLEGKEEQKAEDKP